MSLFSKRKKLLAVGSRKVLIASGDSWTGGSGYKQKKDPFPYWPEVLANKLDMDFINVARGGKGNEFIYNHMIDTLCTTKRIGLSICLWSHFDRWDFFQWTFNVNPDKLYPLKGVHPESAKRHQKVMDAIFEHGGLADGVHNLLKSVRWYHAFQNHCELHNIPYLQMQAFHPTSNSVMKEFLDSSQLDLIDDSKFIGWPMYRELGGKTIWNMLDEVDPEQTRLRISKEDLHPNDKGHDYIAEILYDKYKEIYL